jgi:hypothetical protein
LHRENYLIGTGSRPGAGPTAGGSGRTCNRPRTRKGGTRSRAAAGERSLHRTFITPIDREMRGAMSRLLRDEPDSRELI